MFDGSNCGSPLSWLIWDPLLERKEDARLDEDGKTGPVCFHQLLLNEVENAETEVVNIATKRMLWLLYCMNVPVEVIVLAMEFRQLLDTAGLETEAITHPLCVPVSEGAPHCHG